MLIPLLLAAFVLAPAPSPGEPDQDGVVATAPARGVVLDGGVAPAAPEVGGTRQSTPHGLSTDQQIAQWLATRSSVVDRGDETPVWRDDRKPHGEVSLGVGTGGYRDYAAAVSLPIGENGRLDISVRQSENAYPYGYGYGYAGDHGYDPYFADGGYVFPGEARPGAAFDYERRVARPSGPPNRRGLRPVEASNQ